jgi:hypothetical protein
MKGSTKWEPEASKFEAGAIRIVCAELSVVGLVGQIRISEVRDPEIRDCVTTVTLISPSSSSPKLKPIYHPFYKSPLH